MPGAEVLEARRQPGAPYRGETLTAILNAAKNISPILSLVLVLVSAITLVISGIGIMNIMLVTVTGRTREIGVRLAAGASKSEILVQFPTEAIMVSLSGGPIGIMVGVAIPLSAQLFADIKIPISPLAIRAGVRGKLRGRSDLRNSAGQPRGAVEPDGGVEI